MTDSAATDRAGLEGTMEWTLEREISHQLDLPGRKCGATYGTNAPYLKVIFGFSDERPPLRVGELDGQLFGRDASGPTVTVG